MKKIDSDTLILAVIGGVLGMVLLFFTLFLMFLTSLVFHPLVGILLPIFGVVCGFCIYKKNKMED